MKKKILIVDDELDLADLFVIHFENAGWVTQVASNGVLALEALDQFQPDVILSDITMPEMDGMQLLEALYKNGNETPLIFITGFRDVEKMKKAWGLCAFDFLDKPFNEKLMLLVADSAFEYGKDYVRSARQRFAKIKKAS